MELRSFEKAQYAPLHIGHYALASTHYCHFTSPIRRYADLLVHRLLQCHIEGRDDAAKQMARQIVRDRGAVISEFALGTEPEAKNFPPRNRIISGLSLGVVVVEAGVRSGAGITAQFALEQGREVFAVPGNVNSPASRGTNRLIQLGEAKLVVDAEDMLEELNLSMVFEHTAAQKALPETSEEAALFEHLSGEPVHVDTLSRATGLSSQEVSSTLTLLELKGIVRQVGSMNYVMVREPEPAYEMAPHSEQS